MPACSFGQSCGLDSQCHDNPPGNGQPETPTTCDGFVGEQCAPCGQWACSDLGGQVQTTCAKNEADFPCGQNQVCDELLNCVEAPNACDYGDGNTTRSCSGCGIERCLEDNTWSGLCEDGDSCTGENEQCLDEGASADYANQWECEVVEPAVCDISAYDDQCSQFSIPEDPVESGISWFASTGCPSGQCRRCECGTDGQVSCDSTCAPTPY